MKEDKIPQYHESYTEEENKALDEYLNKANTSDIVELIYSICNLYPASKQQDVKNALENLNKEIHLRDMMEQKYNVLLACEKEWGLYLDSLYKYKDVLKVRQIYDEYKKIKKSCDKKDFFSYLDSKCTLFYSNEFLRRCTFREESKQGIKKPSQPDYIYSSLDSIPVDELSSGEYLEKIGKDNLIYLLRLLLQSIDIEDANENLSDIVIGFLTRRYSYENHKGEAPVFTSKTLSYCHLKEKSIELIEKIKEYQQEALELRASMNI